MPQSLFVRILICYIMMLLAYGVYFWSDKYLWSFGLLIFSWIIVFSGWWSVKRKTASDRWRGESRAVMPHRIPKRTMNDISGFEQIWEELDEKK